MSDAVTDNGLKYWFSEISCQLLQYTMGRRLYFIEAENVQVYLELKYDNKFSLFNAWNAY